MISVVISTYREIAGGVLENGRDSILARAVDSVRAQEYQDWELWIVADAPPAPDVDKIEALLASYDDDRIHVLITAERGSLTAPGVEAKRLGCAHATGGFLAFLDADNEWLPGHLATVTDAFTHNCGLDLVYCDTIVRLRNHRSNAPLRALWPPYRWFGPLVGEEFEWHKPDWNAASRQLLSRFNFIDASEAVMRTDAYFEAGALSEDSGYSSDWVLWNAMLDAKHTCFYRVRQVGLVYWTFTLEHHRRQYWASQVTSSGLPAVFPANLHMVNALLDVERSAAFREKHREQTGD